MEKKFYNDDFEQFLKETADDFRMYPSKRVWNSLYNNLHPGRKWPSLAVCLLLVSSIVFIGVSHKSEITGSASLVKKDAAITQIAFQEKNSAIDFQKTTVPVLLPVKESMQDVASHKTLPNNISATTAQAIKQRNSTPSNQTGTGNMPIAISNNEKVNADNSITVENSNAQTTNIINNNSHQEPIATNQSASVIVDNEMSEAKEEADPTLTKSNLAIASVSIEEKENMEIKTTAINVALIPIAKNSKTAEDQEWIENYAFHNQPTPSLKSKLLSELYITPSYGYRSFNKNVNYDIPARTPVNSLVATQSQQNPKSVYHDPAFNLEAGYNVLYPYTKLVRLKAGIQLNYTNYVVHAQNLGHSTTTTLLLNDPYSGGIELVERPSTLANNPGEFDEKLNNYTIQVSLPFGADIKIAGKHNLQWFVGATLQPTYVLFGNAYLISSDMKNYVYDSKMLRKWNLNAGLETFLSYKTKAGLIFNAGPSFRYQFFSSYDKSYTYNEKLHNIGLKIGMVKNF